MGLSLGPPFMARSGKETKKGQRSTLSFPVPSNHKTYERYPIVSPPNSTDSRTKPEIEAVEDAAAERGAGCRNRCLQQDRLRLPGPMGLPRPGPILYWEEDL